MKKFSKQALAVIMCILMIALSSVPVFAAEKTTETAPVVNSYTPIEDHSIIDCTNRYRMDDGKFNFTIKLPEGTDIYAVGLEFTRDCDGTNLFSDSLFYFSVPGVFGTSLTLKETYGGSDYYELILRKFVDAGVGIKLFTSYNGINYMATDAPNGSTTEGRGYWLSANW